MKKRTVAALVAGALVAGLALGTAGLASGATTQSQTRGAGLGMGGVMRHAGGTIADILAKLTGKKVEDVREQRADGKTFAEIAKASNVPTDRLVDSVLAARKSALDQAVKDKRVTQAQADAALANMESRITAKVNAEPPANCDGSGQGAGGGRGRMGGGGRGAGCGGACLAGTN